jgi:hypothetical protein
VKVRPSLAEDASPESYAEAMIRCQCYAPSCSDHHECALDGWCFGNDGIGFKTAERMLKKLVDSERDVFTRSWLKLALDSIEHHRFVGSKAMDALKLLAVSRRVRREYDLDQDSDGSVAGPARGPI